MSTSTITAYRDGKFCTVEAPEWWESAIGDRHKCRSAINGFTGSCYGDTQGEIAESMPVEGCTGMIVKLYDCDDIRFVWCTSEADYLDFLTARLPALINLATAMLETSSIASLSQAVVSFTRHGQGQHVDAVVSHSSLDRRSGKKIQKRAKTVQRPKTLREVALEE